MISPLQQAASTVLSVELDQVTDKLTQVDNLFKTGFSFPKRFNKLNGRKQKNAPIVGASSIIKLVVARYINLQVAS